VDAVNRVVDKPDAAEEFAACLIANLEYIFAFNCYTTCIVGDWVMDTSR
jgi:hypothetical protein